MSKIITLLFVFLVLGYVALLYGLRIAPSGNLFNQRYRSAFLRSDLVRKFLFLNRPGDARFAYSSAAKDPVLVEVDYQIAREPDVRTKEWMQKMISQTLRKEARVQVSEEEKIPDVQGFSDKQLRKLAEQTRDLAGDPSQGYLHVLYVSSSQDFTSNTGVVLTDRDIFLFQDEIRQLVSAAPVRARIEESTLLHEFGHLLGLEHVERDDCVMSQQVEAYQPGKYTFESIPTEYCEESLEAVMRLRREAL